MLAARAAKGDEEGGCAEALEETLQQVSLLASDLALTNVTETVGFSAKRSARQLWGGARASVAFCYRGLRITLGDVIESCGLIGRLIAGNSLTKQVRVRARVIRPNPTLKRTLTLAQAPTPTVTLAQAPALTLTRTPA